MHITRITLMVTLAGIVLGGGAARAADPANPLIGSWAPADSKAGACAAKYIFAADSLTTVTVAGAVPITHPASYTISPGMVYATGRGSSTRWDIGSDGTITLYWPPFCIYHRVG